MAPLMQIRAVEANEVFKLTGRLAAPAARWLLDGLCETTAAAAGQRGRAGAL